MTKSKPKPKPSATIGEHNDDRALVVNTPRGDTADSLGVTFRALKKAGITPSQHYRSGGLVLTVAEDMDLKDAYELVRHVLEAAGVSVSTYSSRFK